MKKRRIKIRESSMSAFCSNAASIAERIRKRLSGDIRIGKHSIPCADLVFLVVFAAVAIFYCVNAPYGLVDSDESMYQFFCYRLAKGDHLFADDWVSVNLVAFFTYLPYRLFTALFGGTEGLILTLRYLYIAIKLIIFTFLYSSIREYRIWAVLASVLFVGTDICGFKTTGYYSVCLHAVLLACVILFVKKNQTPVQQIAAGFIFSCGVIANPPIAAVWAGYTILVLIRYYVRKKEKAFLDDYAFILDIRIWRRMLYGICTAVAAFVFLWLLVFMGNDWNAIGIGLNKALTYFEVIGIPRWIQEYWKVELYVRLYHPVIFVLSLVVFIAAVPLHRFTKRYERLFFVLLTVLYICASIRLITLPFSSLDDASGESASHPLALSILAVAAYTFTKEKNRRLFAFLVVTFAVSLSVDVISLNLFGSLLLAGSAPAVLLLRGYILEQYRLIKQPYENTKASPVVKSNQITKHSVKRNGKVRRHKDARRALSAVETAKRTVTKMRMRRRARRVFAVVLCILVCFIPCYEAWHFRYMGRFHQVERVFCQSDEPLDVKLDKGLLKGIVTTKTIADNYEKSIRDAEQIGEICKNGLIVVDYDTTVYFHSNLPVCTYGVHVSFNNWDTEEAWWRLYPEKKPDVAYIPYFSLSYNNPGGIPPEQKLAYFKSVADVSVSRGEIGYIVKLSNWHLPEA